jgi:hypothetical protein
LDDEYVFRVALAVGFLKTPGREPGSDIGAYAGEVFIQPEIASCCVS